MDIKELLGKDVEGTANQIAYLESMLETIIAEKGEDWVKQYQARLLDEWDYILELGV